MRARLRQTAEKHLIQHPAGHNKKMNFFLRTSSSKTWTVKPKFLYSSLPYLILLYCSTTEDSSGDVLYEKPYTRITTYAIGMGVGYILRRLPNMQQTLPRVSSI